MRPDTPTTLKLTWKKNSSTTTSFIVKSAQTSTPLTDCSGGINVGDVLEYQVTGLTSDLPYEFIICGSDGTNVSAGITIGGKIFDIGDSCDSVTPTTCTEIGTGSLADPYILCNATQMNNLSSCDMTKHYKLGSDIDLAGFTGTNYNQPVGFKGTFDGDGYTIYNLTYTEGSTDKVGLFSTLSAGAVVKNLTLENVALTGQDKVGAIAGETNAASLENIKVYGAVDGRSYIGGLVGYNSASDLSLTASHAAITGTGDNVGGLTGEHTAGKIRYSYSDGAIDGNDYVGGLVGILSGSGDISSSYSRSALTVSGSNKGALVASNTSIVVPLNNYYDSDVEAVSPVGTARTTVQFSDPLDLINLDYLNFLMPDFAPPKN